MEIIYATKRDKVYNRRKYLIVNITARTLYTEPPRMYYTREELIEVTEQDRKKLIAAYTQAGYAHPIGIS